MSASFVELSLMIGPAVPVPVPKEVIDAVESIVVTSSTTEASGFQISFRLTHRSPLHTIFLLSSGSPIPLVRVIIIVKVAGEQTVLMDGVMTDHEINPANEPGVSTLTVKGEDLSAVMKYLCLTGIPYPAMPEYARVNLILLKYLALGITPLVIPQIFDDIPIPTERIPTHKCTDHHYLTELAANAGYVFYVDPGPSPGMSTAYWGPEIRWGNPQPALSINFDAHTNVESLSFKFNSDKASLPIVYIQEQNSRAVIPFPTPDVSLLKPPLGLLPPIPKRITRIDGMAKFPVPRALMLGLAEASETSDSVTGSGSLDVRRYGRVLKARALVGVRGAGLAFDGFHFVRSVTSTLQRGSFTQSFELVRNALFTNTPRVFSIPVSFQPRPDNVRQFLRP
jgi:hypothetical protein